MERWRQRPSEGHVIASEDILMAAWFLALERSLAHLLGTDPLMWMTGSGFVSEGGTSPGLIALVLLVAALVFTRGPADTSRDEALLRRTFLLGPMLPLLSIYSLIATGVQRRWHLRSHPEAAAARATEPGVHPLFRDDPPWPGPRLPRFVRRTLALPVALIGDALFKAELATADVDIVATFDPRGLLFIAASGAPFILFVVGPRIVAGDTRAIPPWVLRFAIFWTVTFAGTRLWL